MAEYHGQCLCGAVRFPARGPTLFCAHCHCRYCRRAHGAGIVTWVGVAEDQFELISDDASLRWYRSSRESRRGFCSKCGTTLFFQSEVAPGEMHVVRECFDGEIDREPKAHVFHDHRVPWLELGDDLPRFDGDSPQLEKYADIGGDEGAS